MRAAPELKGFFVGFRKVAKRSKTGLPALRAILDDDLPPVLTQFNPFLRQVTPIITTANRYRREITGFLGNVTGATQASAVSGETGGQPGHYLRVSNPLTPEAFAIWSTNRLQMNRNAPYAAPGWMDALAGGLPSFETRQCAAGANGTLDPATPTNPDFIPRANPTFGSTPADLFQRIQDFAFGGGLTTAGTPRVPCTQQNPVQSIGEISEITDYLHVYQGAP